MHTKTPQASLMESGVTSKALKYLFVDYARSRVFSILQKGLMIGQLIIIEGKKKHTFGQPIFDRNTVTIMVHSDNFWLRMLMELDLGISEAYMESEFDVSNLKDFFGLWLVNRCNLSGLSSIISTISGYLSALTIRALGRQNIKMARWNVEVAYDTSNDFFKCFLGDEMVYSCALWDEGEDGGVRGDLTVGSVPNDLERAQQRKIQYILKKARVKAGDRLLEIGSGWGAMAITAAKMGCVVDTVTISKEQKAMVEVRARGAGVDESVRVHLVDYRQLPSSFEHAFDGFVACEMIEAVGRNHHNEFFKIMDWALKVDKGAAVITATSQPEDRYSNYQNDCFARHYHWPNTFLPSATALPNWVQDAVTGRFVLESFEDHGVHYPRTLREWGRRFNKNFKGDIVSRLQEQYPQLKNLHNLEAFKRKWLYMFTYAEAGFARAYTSVGCWTFARPENPMLCCD